MTELFTLQIELSKAVQRRQSEVSSLDLGTEVRPALLELGERIVQALGEVRQSEPHARLTFADLAPLEPWLTPEERQRMLDRSNAVFADPGGSP